MSCYRTAGHLSWWRWRPPSVFTTTATAGSMQRQVVIISVCHKFSKKSARYFQICLKLCVFVLKVRSHDLFQANLRLNRESQRIRRTHKTCKRWRGGETGQPAICNSARLATEATEGIVCAVETVWIFDCVAVASASSWFLTCRWARGAVRGICGARRTGCRRLWRHTVFDSLRPTPTYCSSQGDVIRG